MLTEQVVVLVIDKYPWKVVSMPVFNLNVLQKDKDDYIKNNETTLKTMKPARY